MRSSRVVRASDSQCQSRNCLGFDHSILRHSGMFDNWYLSSDLSLTLRSMSSAPFLCPLLYPSHWDSSPLLLLTFLSCDLSSHIGFHVLSSLVSPFTNISVLCSNPSHWNLGVCPQPSHWFLSSALSLTSIYSCPQLFPLTLRFLSCCFLSHWDSCSLLVLHIKIPVLFWIPHIYNPVLWCIPSHWDSCPLLILHIEIPVLWSIPHIEIPVLCWIPHIYIFVLWHILSHLDSSYPLHYYITLKFLSSNLSLILRFLFSALPTQLGSPMFFTWDSCPLLYLSHLLPVLCSNPLNLIPCPLLYLFTWDSCPLLYPSHLLPVLCSNPLILIPCSLRYLSLCNSCLCSIPHILHPCPEIYSLNLIPVFCSTPHIYFLSPDLSPHIGSYPLLYPSHWYSCPLIYLLTFPCHDL